MSSSTEAEPSENVEWLWRSQAPTTVRALDGHGASCDAIERAAAFCAAVRFCSFMRFFSFLSFFSVFTLLSLRCFLPMARLLSRDGWPHDTRA